MDWRFWERGPKKLTTRVKEQLLSTFKLSPERISQLRCSKKRRQFAGRKVTAITIFDPTDQSLILFEGHVEKDSIYLKAK